MEEIVRRVPELPGLTVPHAQLIGAEPITGLRIKRTCVVWLRAPHFGPEIGRAGSLRCYSGGLYSGGLAVIWEPQGLVWKSDWDEIVVAVLKTPASRAWAR